MFVNSTLDPIDSIFCNCTIQVKGHRCLFIVNEVVIPQKGVISQIHGWRVTHILPRKQTLSLQCGQAGENTPAVLPVTYITNKQQTAFYLEPILMTPSPAGYELQHSYAMFTFPHNIVLSRTSDIHTPTTQSHPAVSSYHSLIQGKKLGFAARWLLAQSHPRN